jgi:hypothetical protein
MLRCELSELRTRLLLRPFVHLPGRLSSTARVEGLLEIHPRHHHESCEHCEAGRETESPVLLLESFEHIPDQFPPEAKKTASDPGHEEVLNEALHGTYLSV